jgi:6-pyruvoyltetrahydropterin/6-carboxytetrahydropterin synthase
MTRITREIGIDMGHRVTNHGSKCRNLHGHRYTIEATLHGPIVESGEEEGMVMDFGFLKDVMMREIDTPCDHGTCLWIRDPILIHELGPTYLTEHDKVQSDTYVLTEWKWGKLYLLNVVPTAENLARHWYQRLLRPVLDHIGKQGGMLYSVRVWETPNCNAVYAATATDLVAARDYCGLPSNANC